MCHARCVNAIFLTWNPEKWNEWDYEELTQKVSESGPQRRTWSVARNRSGIGPGTSAWLFKQGGTDSRDRGIVGHATVLDLILHGPSPVNPGGSSNFVEASFDLLLPEDELLDVPTLEEEIPGFDWRSIRSSGSRIADANLDALRSLWEEHTRGMVGDGDTVPPGTYPEGATKTVLVNKYERSPKARRACIEHHGSTCKVCGFDFGSKYGEIGANYIQVHHFVPVSQLGPDYEVDPVSDLVPLCANCHVMAHRRSPAPYSVEELRTLLN